ncbi:MAG: discoidin domain-containing protein [Clostridia bacterium]|nr:discoidin domain-containing protein [Clostridia bacterium]
MKRILTAFFTLTLVLSLVSGLSLSASAAGGKSQDGEHDLVNFVIGQQIEATSAYIAPEGFFSPELMIDGQWGTYADGEVRLGWNSDTIGQIHGENDEIDLTITLDGWYQLEQIVLKPMQWSGGQGFPRDFDLQVSSNAKTWKTVVQAKDVDATAESDTAVKPIEYTIEPVTIRYFRIHITRSSTQQDRGGSMISAIGELELWGFKTDKVPEDAEPVTFTATFVASNQVVAKVEFPEGATSIEEPPVPAKEGYTGAWAAYTVSDKDFIVRAVYTAVETPTEAPTEVPTAAPTEAPTAAPTEAPTASPTEPDGTSPLVPVSTDDLGPGEEVNGCGSSVVGTAGLCALLTALCGFVLRRRKNG